MSIELDCDTTGKSGRMLCFERSTHDDHPSLSHVLETRTPDALHRAAQNTHHELGNPSVTHGHGAPVEITRALPDEAYHPKGDNTHVRDVDFYTAFKNKERSFPALLHEDFNKQPRVLRIDGHSVHTEGHEFIPTAAAGAQGGPQHVFGHGIREGDAEDVDISLLIALYRSQS